MKYYITKDNQLFAEPKHKEGNLYYTNFKFGLYEEMTEVTNPIWEGKHLPQHDNIGQVELQEDGSFYKWYLDDGTPDLAKIQAEDEAIAHKEWKAERAKLVDELVVDTSVGSWDASEVAQSRMSRAILSMNDTDTTMWVMADNAVVNVTQAELSEALKLAGQAQTAVWLKK